MKENRSKETVSAVHDYKFCAFLKQLDIYDDVMNGDKKCKFCREPVNVNNISSVFAESGDIKFVCDKPDCLSKFSEYLTERQ